MSGSAKKAVIIVVVVVALALAVWSGMSVMGGDQGQSAGKLNGSTAATGKPTADDSAAKDGQPVDSVTTGTTAPPVSRGNGKIDPSGAPGGGGKGE